MNVPTRNLRLDAADIKVLVGAVGTIIDQHVDDEDVRAFTDRLHEIETQLLELQVSIRNDSNGGKWNER